MDDKITEMNPARGATFPQSAIVGIRAQTCLAWPRRLWLGRPETAITLPAAGADAKLHMQCSDACEDLPVPAALPRSSPEDLPIGPIVDLELNSRRRGILFPTHILACENTTDHKTGDSQHIFS
ncbi:hypothetical protein [Aminobacter niigataensis]|uniref:hypothetical protein n=1 Tax=Aminobacter niigataensis TaxID=83265 RepID=UPI00298F0C2E|nr:hypothetical protein [Aminobacter niigataensis]